MYQFVPHCKQNLKLPFNFWFGIWEAFLFYIFETAWLLSVAFPKNITAHKSHMICYDLNLNPNWHELRRQEKCSSLMSIFTCKKVWKCLIKIQLTKSDPKRTRGWKVPCLMPIRVSRSKTLLGNDV